MDEQKPLPLIPIVEAMFKIYVEIEIDTTASFAVWNALLDFMTSYCDKSSLTGRQVVQAVIESSITIHGGKDQMEKLRTVLSTRLNEDWFQEHDDGLAWPLGQQVSYAKPLIAHASKATQTHITMETIQQVANTSKRPKMDLKWCVN